MILLESIMFWSFIFFTVLLIEKAWVGWREVMRK